MRKIAVILLIMFPLFSSANTYLCNMIEYQSTSFAPSLNVEKSCNFSTGAYFNSIFIGKSPEIHKLYCVGNLKIHNPLNLKITDDYLSFFDNEIEEEVIFVRTNYHRGQGLGGYQIVNDLFYKVASFSKKRNVFIYTFYGFESMTSKIYQCHMN